MFKRIIILFILLHTHCFAQTLYKGWVKLEGVGSPISNAHISIPELALTAQTDSLGYFEIDQIPYGNYFIMIKHPGFKTRIIHKRFTDKFLSDTVYLVTGFVDMPEVVVYGTNNSDPMKTANTITQLSQDEMRTNGALNLSDGISKIPGVSQLSTGAGISKPVIRGLFGNRIQTVLFGVRFDNQQWQDEHGLGLSDVGIDRIEIIKGASSLLYGSEAMGGVINIIEEKNAPANRIISDFSTRFFSNTLGNATDVGVKGTNSKINWKLRAGYDSHADYSDGNNNRVLNSRFGGYYLKSGIGFNKRNWINQNNYQFTQNNFGFLMDTVQLKDPPDGRWSRSFDRPHHTVNIHILSTQNTFFLNRSVLKLNMAFQNNERQEQEGGNRISLDMMLNSYIGNVLWSKEFGKYNWSLGSQGFYQTNKNNGSRTIIPDAEQSELSAYSYLKRTGKNTVIEGGLRYDYRHVQTFATGLINTDPLSPGAQIKPFLKDYNAINGSIGISLFNEKNLNVKSNFSSGYRAGNLAELSSNGLHEGTIRYEIGNTNMKIEQNVCGDLNLNWDNDNVTFNASAYYNYFFNYIYLAPSNLQFIGYSIYYYKQQNALIKGFETNLNIHPKQLNWLAWNNSYSNIIGTLKEGGYLPFIPAPKFNSEIKFSKRQNKKLSEIAFKPGINYVFEQNKLGEFETKTNAYYLVNASIHIQITNQKNDISIGLIGNNLLNNAYYDHLSRFKYFGIYNIGRNIALNFKINFK